MTSAPQCHVKRPAGAPPHLRQQLRPRLLQLRHRRLDLVQQRRNARVFSQVRVVFHPLARHHSAGGAGGQRQGRVAGLHEGRQDVEYLRKQWIRDRQQCGSATQHCSPPWIQTLDESA